MVRDSKKRVGFVTCGPEKMGDYYPTKEEPHFGVIETPFTPDDQIAVNALRRQGVEVSAVIWGSPVAIIKNQYDVLVMRSAWDYMDDQKKRDGFVAWLEELGLAGVKVFNPIKAMLWNLDKHYLMDMKDVGIPVVTTDIVEPNEDADLATYIRKYGGAIVVKPCVSAAAKDTFLLHDEIRAEQFQSQFELVRKDRSFMIQPFLKEIRTSGEWSLVFLGGKYSHAVLKKPGDGNFLVQAEHGGSLQFGEPSHDIIAIAKEAFVRLPAAFQKKYPAEKLDPLLYVRIDIIPTAEGLFVSEIEAVEPELFFRAKQGCEQTFCDHIIEAIKT